MLHRLAALSLLIATLGFADPVLSQGVSTLTPVATRTYQDAAFVVRLEGPSKVPASGGVGSFMVTVVKPTGVKPEDMIERWSNVIPEGVVWADLTDNAGRPVKVFLSVPSGTYHFKLSCQVSVDKVDGPDPFAESTLTVVVGSGTTTPDKPTDPVTPPPPTDPVTPPPADAAKVKVPGFRAMLLCEKNLGIPEAFASQDVRKYLNAKCVATTGANGVVTPDWRNPDNDESMDRDYPVFKLYRETLPPGSDEKAYVSFGDGIRGYVGPAPATGEELLKLLQTIGGN